MQYELTKEFVSEIKKAVRKWSKHLPCSVTWWFNHNLSNEIKVVVHDPMCDSAHDQEFTLGQSVSMGRQSLVINVHSTDALLDFIYKSKSANLYDDDLQTPIYFGEDDERMRVIHQTVSFMNGKGKYFAYGQFCSYDDRSCAMIRSYDNG